ncbi:hypothetical protein AB0O68_15560 [Streptomyces sp. NPDC087512]|uniref:hypothetical protein n=1 Tax=Streptomyces sp. NPDC087512 TaxID=3155059 RepID=UPI00341D5910
MGPAEWGDVPTWIGGAGALAAGWFAYQTIRSQRQQIGEQQAFIAEQIRFMGEQRQNLELEREELRAAAEDRRTTQAKRVKMHSRKAGGATDGQGVTTPDSHWVVTVTNESDTPIRQVEVRFGTAYNSAEVYEWNPAWHPASEPRSSNRLTQLVDFIGPGRAVRFESQRYSSATVHNNPPVLFFSDENDARWALTARGDLGATRQEPGNPPPAE